MTRYGFLMWLVLIHCVRLAPRIGGFMIFIMIENSSVVVSSKNASFSPVFSGTPITHTFFFFLPQSLISFKVALPFTGSPFLAGADIACVFSTPRYLLKVHTAPLHLFIRPLYLMPENVQQHYSKSVL